MRNKLFIGLLCCFVLGFSQEGKVTNHIFEGNEKAQDEVYIEAEKAYRKALSLAPEQANALYNLGNTHFLDKQYQEASQRFFQTQKFATSKEDKHKAFHNMGNVYMQQKDYQKGVEAYKNALRNNPSDEETRYNYALAKELLEKEKPPEEQDQDDKKDQNEQQDKDQEEEKEEDKDQEGEEENKDEKDPDKEGDEGDETKDEGKPKNEGDQNKDEKPNEDKDKPEEKKQPPREGQLSPQQVQSLLEAMNNQEKKVQDKVNAKKVKEVPVIGKKDW
jgi:Ca-activated chloride channel family protein|tara:strand:+ start:9270 stop:10094 length:825 start_codon:yes stop_codon:yes gene_type:complete